MFYMYRAFTIAIPDGKKRSYARLLFFLPSMLYWPSSIGKEAWMLFALGLAAFGTARLLTGRPWRGMALAGVALCLAAMVRAHVSGMAGSGWWWPTCSPGRRGGWRARAGGEDGGPGRAPGPGRPAARPHPVVPAGEGHRPGGRGQLGAGRDRPPDRPGRVGFDAPSTVLPGQAALAAVTILFRPFLFEAHNAQVGRDRPGEHPAALPHLASRRAIWQAVRHLRRYPYVAFILVYLALFVVAFSSIGNFGILARERTQLLPFFLVLLAVPVSRARPAATPAPTRDGRVDADRQLARA